MAMTIDQARVEFEAILSQNHDLPSSESLYGSMLSKFEEKFNTLPDDQKDDYVQSLRQIDAEKPSVDNNWANLPFRYSELINRKNDDYGEGYDVDAIAFINREKARSRNDVTYFDPHTIRMNGTLDTDIAAQGSKDKKFLLTGCASVLENSNVSNDLESFLNALDSKGVLRQYENIVIPLSCQNEPGYPQGHAVTLVWNTAADKAMIVDQCGGNNSYPESKKEIAKILTKMGVSEVSLNTDALTGANRNDCACVSSMVVNDILAGKDFSAFTKECYGNDTDQSKIDANHEKDQQLLLQALFNMHRNSPVFQLYCEAKGLDFEKLDDDGKKQAIEGFKLFKESDFDLNARESENEAFKSLVRPYMQEVFDKHPHREFKEYTDPEYPKALSYKNEDGSKIILTSEASGRIESKTLEDHQMLCEYAKNMGCKNMDFGPYFKTHLDEAALLYLAALKTGMGVKNAPDIEKFKELPQYDEIKLRLKVQKELKDLQEKKETLAANDDYRQQKEIMSQYVDDFKNFLNNGSPQQQAWVELLSANKETADAKSALKDGLTNASPEVKKWIDTVRSEQHKNREESKTETVEEILERLNNGQSMDASVVTGVEDIINLHNDFDQKKSVVLVKSQAFKAEIPNIKDSGAKEYCEAWKAVQDNPDYIAYRDAEAGYKDRINAAFGEYLGNCPPEQQAEKIAALKEGVTGKEVSDVERQQIKDNAYQPDGQKAQEKSRRDIVQSIYAHSYRNGR